MFGWLLLFLSRPRRSKHFEMFVKFCFFAFFFLAHSQDLSIDTEGHVFERDLETSSTTPAPMTIVTTPASMTTVTTPASMIPDVSRNQLYCIIAIVVGCVVSFFICAVCSCYLCKRYSKVIKMVDSIFLVQYYICICILNLEWSWISVAKPLFYFQRNVRLPRTLVGGGTRPFMKIFFFCW